MKLLLFILLMLLHNQVMHTVREIHMHRVVHLDKPLKCKRGSAYAILSEFDCAHIIAQRASRLSVKSNYDVRFEFLESYKKEKIEWS